MKSDKGNLPATSNQREIYREISGDELAPQATRLDAVREIKKALAVQLLSEGQLPDSGAPYLALNPEGTKAPDVLGTRCIVPDRLFLVTDEHFNASHTRGMTLLVNLSELEQMSIPRNGASLFWDAGQNVDEKLLEGVVRLVASAMRGVRQRVLIVGPLLAISTLAACVLREFAGADEQAAVSAVRRACGGDAILGSSLLETVRRYRVS